MVATRSFAALAGTILFLLVSPRGAAAQSYLEAPNSLSVSLGYTYAPSGKLVAKSGGLEVPGTTMFVHIFTPRARYVTPIDGLAVEAELNMVALKVGDDDFQHFPVNGPYDDGSLHFTPTDFKGGLRYQIKAIEKYLGLSFFLGGTIPTHDYPTLGLAAPGHRLKALNAGVAVGRTLDPVLPNLFVQAEYEFALRERVDVDEDTKSFNRNFSEASATIGYFLPWGIDVGVDASSRFSHGGVTFNGILFEPPSVQYNHDRLLDEDFIVVGPSVGYEISDGVQVGALAHFFVYGENTRKQNIYSLYASYQIF